MAPFAMAAIVGTRAGAHPLGIGARSVGERAPNDGSFSGRSACLACCMSLGLIVGGVSFLLASLYNDRVERVNEYDLGVQRWTSLGRPTLAAAAFNVSAVFNASASAPSTGREAKGGAKLFRMEPSTSADWNFSDSEDADGIDLFQPLKFVTRIVVPNDYGNLTAGTEANMWDDMPSRADAATVRFEFTAISTVRGGGAASVTTSHFATAPLPLRFVETVRARSPAPDVKCRNEQHGMWRGGKCYVVKVLAGVCMQIHAVDRTAWQLRKGDAVDALGCDPKIHWDVASYVVDPCWGRTHVTQQCRSITVSGSAPQIVELTLRSVDDPLLFAETLTKNRFDFGFSAYSQRVLGFTMLAIGACMSCPTLVFLGRCLR